jgi:hypothetical protein
MSDPIERYNSRSTPPRPPEIRVGDRVPPEGGKTVIAKFDVSRNGKRYVGHLWTGQQGAMIQWVFLNDPGTDSIIGTNEYVEVYEAPEWFIADSSSGYGSVVAYGKRYVARSPIWGVLA